MGNRKQVNCVGRDSSVAARRRAIRLRAVKLTSAVAAAFLAVCVFTVTASAKVENSHHDFSRDGYSGGEMCILCHVPHNASTTALDAPLWNHALSVASYTPYSSPTLDATVGQPSGRSKLCLSCHDGTVALDSFGSRTGTTYATFGNLGTNLNHTHPISFTYDTTLANTDKKLRDPATAPSGLGGTIATDLLRSGQLECTSCHDVHVARNTAGCVGCHTSSSTVKTLSLWKSNDASALCLTCHNM